MPKEDYNPIGVRITFGKYKGRFFAKIPEPYLKWIVRNNGLWDGWRKYARKELKRRSQEIKTT